MTTTAFPFLCCCYTSYIYICYISNNTLIVIFITFYLLKKLREEKEQVHEFVILTLFTTSDSFDAGYLVVILCHFLTPVQLCSHKPSFCCYNYIIFYISCILYIKIIFYFVYHISPLQLCIYCFMCLLAIYLFNL
jgi:GTPase SAR1 family protein